MCHVEEFVVLSVTSFYLAIMSRYKGMNRFALDAMLHETNLKNSRSIQATMRTEMVGEFSTVVSLNNSVGHGKVLMRYSRNTVEE